MKTTVQSRSLSEGIIRGIGLIVLVILFSIAPRSARADEPATGKPAPEAAAPGVELTVDPAAEPVPALKLHLLPPIEEQVPGNAVPIYLRLVHEQNDEWRKKLRERPEELNDVALAELPVTEASDVLESFDDVLDQLSAAARRSDAEWDYVLENRDPLLILLPDAQSMRGYARLLVLNARYEMRTGNHAAARGALEDGMALGQHVARAPFLVNQLIGIAIDGVMLEEVDALVQQPDAENLYWALAMLPRPLISLERGLATERQLFVLKFSELAHPDRIKSSGEWQRHRARCTSGHLRSSRWSSATPRPVLLRCCHQYSRPRISPTPANTCTKT